MREVIGILRQYLETQAMSISQLQELCFNLEDILQASQNIMVSQAQIPFLPLSQLAPERDTNTTNNRSDSEDARSSNSSRSSDEVLSPSWEVVKDPPSPSRENKNRRCSTNNRDSDNVSSSAYSWKSVEKQCSFVRNSESISNLERMSPVSSSWEVVEASPSASPSFPLQESEEVQRQPLTFLQKLHDKQYNDSTQDKVDEVTQKLVSRNLSQTL